MSDGDGCFSKKQKRMSDSPETSTETWGHESLLLLNLKIMLCSFGAKTRGCVNPNYLWAPKIKHVFLQHMSSHKNMGVGTPLLDRRRPKIIGSKMSKKTIFASIKPNSKVDFHRPFRYVS